MADELMEYQDTNDLAPTQDEVNEAGLAIQESYEPTEITPSSYEPAPPPATYEDTSSDLAPYKFWDKRSKDVFRSAPAHIKKAWVATQKRADARAYKVIEEIKQNIKAFDDLAAVLLPYVDAIEATGLSIPEYLKYTIEADKELTNNPLDFICSIMDKYDIYNSDLDKNFQSFYSRQQLKKETAPIREELEELKVGLQAGTEQQEQQKYDDMVYQFFMQTDQRGQLIYPYAEDLRPIMISIIESTGETDLDKVYKMAFAAATEGGRQSSGGQESGFALTNQDNVPNFGGAEVTRRTMNKLQERDYLNNVLRNVASRYGVNVT